jgi:hypothetical protein
MAAGDPTVTVISLTREDMKRQLQRAHLFREKA